MNFLVDAQLPPALAEWLRQKGFESRHVSDLGLRHARDADIWKVALEGGSVLISKDEDFAFRRVLSVTGPQVVWIRFGNCSNPALLERLTPHLDKIVSALNFGEKIVEIV